MAVNSARPSNRRGVLCSTAAVQQLQLYNLIGRVEAVGLEAMIEEHGMDTVASVLSDLYMEGFTNEIRNAISDSDLPQYVKDSLFKDIDDTMMNGGQVSADVTEQIANSEAGAQAGADGAADAEEAVSSAGAPAEASPAAGEAEGGGHVTTAEDVRDDAGKPEEEEEGPANWLVALARSLSKIQSGFLDKAMAASDTMANESANAGKDSEVFLRAQGEYTAYIQLFTIFSNQTSTSIKSIGEALAGISRKQ